MTWASIIAGLVSLFSSLAAWFRSEASKQEGRNEVELEGRRELDRLNGAADAARDSVPDDIEAIRSDPRNRRRRKV
jgi:hypothetical protein